ncbi:MAG: zf-HC2 domain-containing protein [Bacteroidota bacterium]
MQTLREDKNSILEKTPCLSPRELLNYSMNKLSEKEKRKVEDHLLECEKCISLYQDVLNKKETADKTGKYADLFPEGGKNKMDFNFPNIKKAAVVVAVLFSMIVLYGAYSKFSKNSVKDSNAYSPITEPEKTNADIVTNPEPVSSPAKEEKKIDQPPVEKNKTIAETNEQKIPEGNKKEVKKQDDIIANKIKPVITKPEKPVEKNKIESAPVVSNDLKKQLPVKDSVVKIPAPPVTAYIKNYKISKSADASESYSKELEFIFKQIDHSDYKNALTETGKFLADYPSDVNGKYYKGYIYYQMLDNDHAMTEMDGVLSRHDKIFYDDARWYKALILNRTQKPDEAKKILNELSAQNNSYSAKAKQLLELMGEK